MDLKIACEIFADRNYDDNGYLVSRDKPHALITDSLLATKNVSKMLNEKSIYCYSGKRIPCKIDSICVHGDGEKAIEIVSNLKKNLITEGFQFKPLNQLKKFLWLIKWY